MTICELLKTEDLGIIRMPKHITDTELDDLKKITTPYLNECNSIIFDFSKTEYIGTLGLGFCLVAEKIAGKKGNELYLVNMNQNFIDIFHHANLGQKMNIYSDTLSMYKANMCLLDNQIDIEITLNKK